MIFGNTSIGAYAVQMRLKLVRCYKNVSRYYIIYKCCDVS